MPEHADHADFLPTVHRGVFEAIEGSLSRVPANRKPCKGELGRGTLRQPPGSQICRGSQTIQSDPFGIVNVAQGRENAGVRNLEVAPKFFRRESGAAVKQVPTGPRGVACAGEAACLKTRHPALV